MQNNTQFVRWTSDEEDQLINEFSENKSIECISKIHNRSRNAITLRLTELALRMKRSGISLDEIFRKTGITGDAILRYEEEKRKSYADNKPLSQTLREKEKQQLFGSTDYGELLKKLIQVVYNLTTAIDSLKERIDSLKTES